MLLFVEGSVVNFTNRFICAVITQLGGRYLSWPNEQEKSQIKHEIEEKYGFPGCIGFIDGSLFPLAFAPNWCPEEFYSRKSFYATTGMIVCDHKKRITHLFTGYVGSAHDMRVFDGSQLANNPEKYFSSEDYLLADSAYTASTTIVPVYRKIGKLEVEKSKFNVRHSSARVCVEHCIGILKSRFQSLKDLRMPVRDKKDVARINAWIKTCCILNNFLIDINDDSEFQYTLDSYITRPLRVQASGEEFIIDERRPLCQARNGDEKRLILKRILRDKHLL